MSRQYMTQQDWEEVDRSSRTLIKKFLEAIGATEIQDSVGNCSYDIKCKIKGVGVGIEVKDRTFAHDRFNDVFAEGIKKECNNRRIANGEFQKCWIVNVFTDSTFAIADANDPNGREYIKSCPMTSLVKGGSKAFIAKKCLSLPQKKIFSFWAEDGKMQFKKVK